MVLIPLYVVVICIDSRFVVRGLTVVGLLNDVLYLHPVGSWSVITVWLRLFVHVTSPSCYIYIYSSWMELFSLSWLAFSRWWFGKWMVANWSVCGFWCRSLRLVVNCKFAGSWNQLHWMFSWLAVVFFFLLSVFKAVFGRRNCLRKVSFCSLWLFFMCCESMFLV